MKVTIVEANDWQGVYVSGEIEEQNHSLFNSYYLGQLLDRLNINWEIVECDEDWLMNEGYLPDNLKDVKLKKKIGRQLNGKARHC
jgi:hypothetical protein